MIRPGPLRWLFVLVALILATQAISASAALSVTDDSGATVTLAAPARRVVSLAPHVTEMLLPPAQARGS
jgi:iron complex transport system substrate-binding protein